MFSIATGQVIKILHETSDFQELLVQVEGSDEPERAYNYPQLFHQVQVGEKVALNTSAVKLGLGTGGRHFVIPNTFDVSKPQSSGHIMKLRYTPWQFPILAAEEEASPFHEALKEADSLNGTPVVIAPLHSMLPGIILGFRRICTSSPKIAYIMTDAAAIPIALSQLVRDLKERRLLDLTVTSGHAFGGDIEGVNIPSSLLAAYQAIQPDLIIVALGPGIVGTGTTYGFSGIEQSWVIDLVAKLKGIPVVVPRISFADKRERHQSISHHSTTILNLANNPAFLGISRLIPSELVDNIKTKLKKDDLLKKHQWMLVDDRPAAELFSEYGLQVKSMGRGIQEDPWFFQSTVTGGYLAGLILLKQTSALTKILE